MVDQIAVVQFQVTATELAAGFVDVTDPSITEDVSCGIILFSASTSDNTDNQHGATGIGFFTTNTRSIQSHGVLGLQIEDGVGTPDNNTKYSAIDCVLMPNPTSAIAAAAAIQAQYSAQITNGVRLTVSAASLGTKCVAILFAGLANSDINNIASGVSGAANSCQDVTAGLYEPDCVMFITRDHVSPNEANAQAMLGFSVNGGTITNVGSLLDYRDGGASGSGTTTDADGYAATTQAALQLNRTTRVQEVSLVDSYDATGFSMTSAAGNNVRARRLAMQFTGDVQIAAKQFTAPSSTGDTFFDLGFAPDLVIGMSTLLSSTDTLTDGATAAAGGFFVTGIFDERAYTWRETEGVNVSGSGTDASNRQEDVGLLTYDHNGNVAQRATWVGASGTGFTLNFSAATAGTFVVLGIQLEQTPLVTAESLFISDGAALLLSETLLGDLEGVSIADTALLLTTDLPLREGDSPRRGSTRVGGAERGRTYTGGAEQGSSAY